MAAGRIEACFSALREKGEKALIPFLTAGDPDLETTEALVVAMAEAGADIIELGIPFSDPSAEGPTIQRSSARALERGTSLRTILDLVGRLRERVKQPLVLMGYANPIHAMGAEIFAKRASEVGVDGVIIPDLTPEDGAPYLDPIRAAGIDTILLAAPTTSEERLTMLVEQTQGFLYYVSLQGVTGARASLSAGIEEKVRLAQSLGDVPVCVGFGVGTKEHAEEIGAFADGVVVGSAIVDRIEEACGGLENAGAAKRAAVDAVAQFIRELKEPLSR
ncbi:MAG TPA: tryptophan synthase subunit alpha [Myxococcales bacterium]|jgi:tryptophan synthase alpha chain|nr:tryptophan synthase subunit alpha [Myxococcales bacterium]HIK86203.1 tryptophan synthase subunit alpha [Myxococcales bacterium]